jgi:pimeloyl-ACP methyl ester carboxylesterase
MPEDEMPKLREEPSNRGWPRWRTSAGDEPPTIVVGTVKSRGFRISYEDAGSGRPLLLIPGFTMMAADWRETGCPQRLATSWRVITVDPLGHGLSDKPHDAEAYRWPGVAADIVAVMDAAGVDKAALWGYSRGAALAAEAAVEFPERVSAVVLGGEDLLVRPPAHRPGDWADRLWHGEWAALFEVMPVPEEDRAFAAETLDASALGASIVGRRISGDDGVISIDGIACPTFVYAGGSDEPNSPEGFKGTADRLGVHLHVLDALTHEGAFSASDQILPLVTDFLDRLDTRQARR